MIQNPKVFKNFGVLYELNKLEKLIFTLKERLFLQQTVNCTSHLFTVPIGRTNF
jgi:hypothetical protein